MTKINGQQLVESIDVPDNCMPGKSIERIKRQVDRGYKAFLAKRGLRAENTFRMDLNAGMEAGKAGKITAV